MHCEIITTASPVTIGYHTKSIHYNWLYCPSCTLHPHDLFVLYLDICTFWSSSPIAPPHQGPSPLPIPTPTVVSLNLFLFVEWFSNVIYFIYILKYLYILIYFSVIPLVCKIIHKGKKGPMFQKINLFLHFTLKYVKSVHQKHKDNAFLTSRSSQFVKNTHKTKCNLISWLLW